MMVELRSKPHKVTKIKAKTNAKMFKDVKEGDLLCFSMELKHKASASGGGVYASYVRVENVTQGASVYKSQSELTNILSRVYELEAE
jgi:hypothetical protein